MSKKIVNIHNCNDICHCCVVNLHLFARIDYKYGNKGNHNNISCKIIAIRVKFITSQNIKNDANMDRYRFNVFIDSNPISPIFFFRTTIAMMPGIFDP